ncbi:MAG TPA: SRPBCC family protein [Marmoricola sp.]|nr:SRPBCC family protein [Marmoricola sp.]
MELTHDFTVPASVEETWAALTDIEGVAGCFPGAKVTSVEDDSFKGTVKVKLGPIALTYAGSGEFTSKDDSAHSMTLAAKGKDRRGNGTAGADVKATMAAEGDRTRVTVVTDLQITGKPAQFGRGVIQDVSDKLLGQFTRCLEQKLAGPPAEEPAAPEAAAPETAAAASAPAADQDAEPASQPAGAAAAASPAEDQDAGPASAPPMPEAPPVTPIGSAPSAGQRVADTGDGALDLGATVLPVLVKHYGRQIGAGLGLVFVLLLLRRLLRR